MKSLIAVSRRFLRKSRTLTGLLLILASIVGVVGVVQASAPGDVVVMAARFLPSGAVISEDDLTTGRVSTKPPSVVTSVSEVVNRVVGVDVYPGDIVSLHDLEPTLLSRIEVAVPLGVEPPSTIAIGTPVDLWAIDSEGVEPPYSVARHAPVVALTETGFGGDTVLTVMVSVSEIESVLSSLGTNRDLVATSGGIP